MDLPIEVRILDRVLKERVAMYYSGNATFCYGGPWHGRKTVVAGPSLYVQKAKSLKVLGVEDGLVDFTLKTYSLRRIQWIDRFGYDKYADVYVCGDFDLNKIARMADRYRVSRYWWGVGNSQEVQETMQPSTRMSQLGRSRRKLLLANDV